MTGVLGGAAAFVLWDVACVIVLRTFSICIPFAFPFHFYKQRERDLVASLQGRSRNICILVSGFLFFTCPLFLSSTAYDLLSGIKPDPAYYTGSAAVLVIMAIAGKYVGHGIWKKTHPYSLNP